MRSPQCVVVCLSIWGGGGEKGTVKGLHSGATRCCSEQWNWQCNFGQFCGYCQENGNRGRKWRPLRLTEISGGRGSSVALCNNRPTLQYLSHFVITFVALCNKKKPVALCNRKAVVLCNKLEKDDRRTRRPRNNKLLIITQRRPGCRFIEWFIVDPLFPPCL